LLQIQIAIHDWQPQAPDGVLLAFHLIALTLGQQFVNLRWAEVGGTCLMLQHVEQQDPRWKYRLALDVLSGGYMYMYAY